LGNHHRHHQGGAHTLSPGPALVIVLKVNQLINDANNRLNLLGNHLRGEQTRFLLSFSQQSLELNLQRLYRQLTGNFAAVVTADSIADDGGL